MSKRTRERERMYSKKLLSADIALFLASILADDILGFISSDDERLIGIAINFTAALDSAVENTQLALHRVVCDKCIDHRIVEALVRIR